MPGRGTPKVTVRLDERAQLRLAAEADARDMSSAEVLRALARWWIGDVPEPPDGPWQAQDSGDHSGR